MKFSIILPVRNGGEYVKECVRSILSQSYTDFNLLILDNNSTDGTVAWVQSLNNDRIIIYLSEKSLSIEENWGRIVTIEKNEFITLIGHDDILAKDYLKVMSELIYKHPDAGLYQTHFNYIDSKGKKIRDCKPMATRESAEEFLEKFLHNNIDVMGTGFMMRSEDYDRLGGIQPYPNLLFADFELWINLTKISYKATAKEVCFSFRLHQSTTASSPDTKFQQSLEKFIYFLSLLKNERKSFNEIIIKSGADFLTFYCRGLSHRLLRTAKSKRNGLTVKKFINNCYEYATVLGVEDSFKPNSLLSVRLAKAIDSTRAGRFIFLTFKRIYSYPLLK